MNVLTRGSANEVALLVITTDLGRLHRCATSAAEIDASAEVSFRSSTQIYYGAHEILGLLTNMQRALFDRDDFIVLDDALSIPPAVTRFPAKDPSVHVTAFGVVTWHVPDYSSTVSGLFTTYGLLITDLEPTSTAEKS